MFGLLKLGLVFVDDRKMKKINRQYLGRNVTTDVVSFPIKEKLPDGFYHLGEIVVSLDQARRQAKELGVSEEEEIARLVTHGALHLLGYEEGKIKGGKKMQQVQEKVVKTVMKEKSKKRISVPRILGS